MALRLLIEADGVDADDLGRRMLAIFSRLNAALGHPGDQPSGEDRISARIMDTELTGVRVLDVTLTSRGRRRRWSDVRGQS